MIVLDKVLLVAILVISIESVNCNSSSIPSTGEEGVIDDSSRTVSPSPSSLSSSSSPSSSTGQMVFPIPNKNSSSLTVKKSTSIGSNQNKDSYVLLSTSEGDGDRDQQTCPADSRDSLTLPLQQQQQTEDEMKMETEIVVVTLNCWGIRFVSKDRVARMAAIAEELATGKYDFVFLQEVWTTEDYERIKTRTGDVLPYSHYFFSGVIGAGICIFSRSPIKSAFFHQWAVNGYIHKIQHGDWFGGKGIGMVEVDHRGLRVNLYTAHLHAEYDRANDEYIAHRVTQAFDTAQFISVTSRHADVVIVGGDLNTEPGDLTYRLIFNTANLHDACEETGKKTSPELINTCETAKNSYTPSSSLKLNPYGKRIDYIAYKSGGDIRVSALSCETSWPDRVPGQQFSYSDHEAVVTRLRINKSSTSGKYANVLRSPSHMESKKESLEEGVEICNHAINHLQSTKNMYILLSVAMFVLLSMTSSIELHGFLSPVVPLIRVVLVFIMFFGIFMSVIWHRMEVHGILAGKLGMLLELGTPIQPNMEVLPERHSLLTGSGDAWTDVDPKDCLP